MPDPMTPISLRLPAELVAEIDSRAGEDRGEGRPSTIVRDLGRYYLILADALAGVRLEESEASLICDALNGCYLDDYVSPVTPSRARVSLTAEVEDHIRLNGADEKWSVDARLLLAKLRDLSAIECLAVWDAAARAWRAWGEDSGADTATTLREVGLLRQKKDHATQRPGRKE